jgi:hypothetical protein
MPIVVVAHEKAMISPQKLTQELSILAQELPLEGRFGRRLTATPQRLQVGAVAE